MDLKKIIGGVLLAVLALWIIGWGTSRFHKPDAPQVVQASPNEKWHETEEKSPMDDSKSVILALDAEGMAQGPHGAVRPKLMIRCQEGKTESYVVTGMAANIEGSSDGGPSEYHTVRVRFDDAPPKQFGLWSESTDHQALFIGNGMALAKELSKANAFTFQFTPFDGSPQVVQFDVQGLDPHLHKLAEACGWAYELNFFSLSCTEVGRFSSGLMRAPRSLSRPLYM